MTEPKGPVYLTLPREVLGDAAGYLAKGESFWLKMDGESFLPGFTKELEGAKIDSENNFEIIVFSFF